MKIPALSISCALIALTTGCAVKTHARIISDNQARTARLQLKVSETFGPFQRSRYLTVVKSTPPLLTEEGKMRLPEKPQEVTAVVLNEKLHRKIPRAARTSFKPLDVRWGNHPRRRTGVIIQTNFI